jgi:hypothetical protein
VLYPPPHLQSPRFPDVVIVPSNMKPSVSNLASLGLALASTASAQATCDLPSTYRWTSTGPLAEPRNGWVSLKDFTTAPYEGKHLVYATTHDRGTTWGSMAFSLVNNFTELSTANQMPMNQATVAPSLFYFPPKNIWVLAYQCTRFLLPSPPPPPPAHFLTARH